MAQSRWFLFARWGILVVLALVLGGAAWLVFRPIAIPADVQEEITAQLTLSQQYVAQNTLFQVSLPSDWDFGELSDTPLQTTLRATKDTLYFEIDAMASVANIGVLPPKVCNFEGEAVSNSISLGLGRIIPTEVREFAQSTVPRERVEDQPAEVMICGRPLSGGEFTFGWPETGIVAVRYGNSAGLLTEGDLTPLYEMISTLRPTTTE